MISQIKVQLNLYTHRDKDNVIIEQLGLSTTDKPNEKIREVLYLLSANDTSNKLTHDTAILEKQIKDLKNLVSNLEIELKTLKQENLDLKHNNKLNSEVNVIDDKKEIKEDKKLNSQLLASAKSLSI